MCVEKKGRSWVWYSIAICLGVAVGYSPISWLQEVATGISEIFMRMFQFISLPLICLSLMVTLATQKMGQSLWRRMLLYTLGTTLIAALVACGLYLLIQPDSVHQVVSENVAIFQGKKRYWDHIIHVMPSNIISPFLEYHVMTVLLISVVFGLAIAHIRDEKAKETVQQFLCGIHLLFLVLTRWIVKVIPIGLFGFITTCVMQIKGGMDLRGVGKYLLVVVAANMIQGCVVLPLWLKRHGIRPLAMLRAMMPALSVAFFSKSSIGALPVTMDVAEKKLHIDFKLSRGLFPLCTNINMNGCAAFIFITVIYLMQNHGIIITPSTLLLWVVISTIAAFGNASIPMGCFFLSASLLSSMQIPIALLGIILPFYGLIDMLETALNVWSDACVIKVVSVREKEHADLEKSSAF